MAHTNRSPILAVGTVLALAVTLAACADQPTFPTAAAPTAAALEPNARAHLATEAIDPFSVVSCTEDGTFTCTINENSLYSPELRFWDYGDSDFREARHMATHTKTYGSGGIYTITLTIEGGTPTTQTATVVGPIYIWGLISSTSKGNKFVDVIWSGAVSDRVTIHRTLLPTGKKDSAEPLPPLDVENTGEARTELPRSGTYEYRVCNQVIGTGGSEMRCSFAAKVKV